MKKIFIIHGWTYTTDAWKQCVFELTKAGFEPILLSVPGLSHESSEVWNLDKYVEWLGQSLGAEQDVTLVGHSNGGRIAIAYAARHPGKISQLVLVDAAGIFHNELPLRIKRIVFGLMAKVGRVFVSSPEIRKIFYRLIGARDYERAPENMRETMKNLISVDLTFELSNIKIPTLIIWGKDDTATPVSDAFIMNKEISGSKLVVIDGAKHSPHLTHPQKVVGEIQNFIS